MSVERRIREGLRANTERVRPALEHDEEVVMRKVEERRRERRVRYTGAGALVAAAVAVGAVWIPSAVQDEATPSPAEVPEAPAATPLPASGPVWPGSYEARFNGGGPSTPRATVAVPSEGFVAWDGSAVLGRDGIHAVGFWTAAKVKQDPCDLSDLGDDPGPLVEDLARALEAQEVTRATRPVPIALGGYEGLFLELTTPGRGAADGCPNDRYELWTIGAGGPRYVGPGQVQSLWILDVDGSRVVVNAVGSDDGTELGRQVAAMVRSVDIVD